MTCHLAHMLRDECRLIFKMHIRDFMVCGESEFKTINSRHKTGKRVFTNDIVLIRLLSLVHDCKNHFI